MTDHRRIVQSGTIQRTPETPRIVGAIFGGLFGGGIALVGLWTLIGSLMAGQAVDVVAMVAGIIFGGFCALIGLLIAGFSLRLLFRKKVESTTSVAFNKSRFFSCLREPPSGAAGWVAAEIF